MNIGATVTTEGFDEIKSSIEAEAMGILQEMSRAAVNHLSELDDQAGHHYLATLWDATDPVDDGQSISAEVFSHAEDEVFHDAGWEGDVRVKQDPRYPIEGKVLLAILEGGAQPHPISPRGDWMLKIPIPGGAARISWFTSRFGGGTGDEKDYYLAKGVDNPGVTADGHVAATADWLEQQLVAFGEEAENAIEVKLK